ncbi:MAG: cobalamin B12-binding domain-containing protein, partial [Chloroflexi bacterium]|nr:cobalamin B12-binding domain-containing protein [Chloroflexota bacterium]
MRVLLINPRFQLPIDTRTTPHLGIAYLAAVSEQRGDEVRVFDMDIEEVKLTDFVRDYQPDIVGITSNTPQVKQGWHAAREIKSVLDVPIVQGGPHVSALPEEALNHSDSVVIGEAESIWNEILRDVEKGELKPIYHSNNLIEMTGMSIPRRDLLDREMYVSCFNTIQATRGCPFNCGYCANSSLTKVFGRKVRKRSVENCLEELKMVK